MSSKKQGYEVVLDVLNAILEADNPVGTTQVATLCSINRSQSIRALQALETRGWARHTSFGWMLGDGVQQRLTKRAENLRRSGERLFKQAEMKFQDAKLIEIGLYTSE